MLLLGGRSGDGGSLSLGVGLVRVVLLMLMWMGWVVLLLLGGLLLLLLLLLRLLLLSLLSLLLLLLLMVLLQHPRGLGLRVLVLVREDVLLRLQHVHDAGGAPSSGDDSST